MAKNPTKSGAAPGTQIFYATNRDELADGFGMDAAPGQERRLILGSVQVEALKAPLKTEAPRDLLAPPDKSGSDDFADAKAGSSAKVLDAWLTAAAAPKAVAVLFLHGFSNSFNSGVQRAAQMVDFYAGEDLHFVPLVFSWPSDGKILTLQPGSFNFIDGAVDQYRRDQADAEAAGPALARLLTEIRRARARQEAKAAKGTRLALLAHSMGNHALASGLLSLDNGLMTAQMRALFDEAYLAAPDVSSASFAPGRSLRLIAALARRVTVGISFDSTLNVASRIANGKHTARPFRPRRPLGARRQHRGGGLLHRPRQRDRCAAGRADRGDLAGYRAAPVVPQRPERPRRHRAGAGRQDAEAHEADTGAEIRWQPQAPRGAGHARLRVSRSRAAQGAR